MNFVIMSRVAVSALVDAKTRHDRSLVCSVSSCLRAHHVSSHHGDGCRTMHCYCHRDKLSV